MEEDEEEDGNYEAGNPNFNDLDTAFYKINNALMAQAEELISKMPP
jgi:hypothetical protein